MNSTQWCTLTIVDTHKGWFLTYINRSDAEKTKKRKMFMEDFVAEERQEWGLRRQIQRAAARHVTTDNDGVDHQPPNKVLKRDTSIDGCKIKLNLAQSLARDNVEQIPYQDLSRIQNPNNYPQHAARNNQLL
ncbi:hypothetical protein POM88_046421 [Heracleum sosnowskyi]|uniref:Uncharacterized protein n=1 Tax=Heracleum sosnowskyi TaxID=360622 RepID=A0AAD8H996_9APIA|nr:hypothetical protein POM88_046421 [Heracleum sosnowskyi]